MVEKKFLPLTDYLKYPEAEMKKRASEFYAEMRDAAACATFQIGPLIAAFSKTV